MTSEGRAGRRNRPAKVVQTDPINSNLLRSRIQYPFTPYFGSTTIDIKISLNAGRADGRGELVLYTPKEKIKLAVMFMPM